MYMRHACRLLTLMATSLSATRGGGLLTGSNFLCSAFIGPFTSLRPFHYFFFYHLFGFVVFSLSIHSFHACKDRRQCPLCEPRHPSIAVHCPPSVHFCVPFLLGTLLHCCVALVPGLLRVMWARCPACGMLFFAAVRLMCCCPLQVCAPSSSITSGIGTNSTFAPGGVPLLDRRNGQLASRQLLVNPGASAARRIFARIRLR
mmetsp:Transcript_21764/g.46878  ORF Transcript_21764/g.46878 Transcript_21764/m.46878 type:complete len:202 (+) Transcript_21764:75-680(+)